MKMKRIVSICLVLCMLMGLMSVGVYGAEESEEKGEFRVSLLDVDSSTFANVSGALRMQATTAGTNWKIDSSKCGALAANGSKYSARWQQGDNYAFLTIQSARGDLAFNFTAPSAGTYDITANFQPEAGMSQCEVYINGTLVGTLEGNDPNGSYTIVKQEKLKEVELLEGDYANSLVLRVIDGNFQYQGLSFTKKSTNCDVSFLDVDSATLAEKGYLTPSTAGINWKIDSSKCGKYMADGTSKSGRWQQGATYAFLTFESARGDLAFNFTAPSAGTYDITAKLQPESGLALCDVFVNGIYVGTLDGNDPNGSYTLVQQQKLAGITLLEGEYANSLVLRARNGKIQYQYYRKKII